MGTSVNPAGGNRGAEHLDADAVCAQCGTVNPEETLLCKVCGNNLRDQRQLRLNAEAHLNGEATAGKRRIWISRGLGVFGLVLVLLAALNVGRIQQWMINAQLEGTAVADQNWFGPRSASFDALVEQLRANMPTQAQMQAAISAPTVVSDYSGYYVVTYGAELTGAALVRHAPASPADTTAPEDRPPTYDFVAILPNMEVRGTAQLRGNNLMGDWSNTAVRYQNNYASASGVVIQKPNGVIDGFGQAALGESGVSFLAYKLPNP